MNTENMKLWIETIKDIISENKSDIKDDTTSEFARLRIRQSNDLQKVIDYL
jgi:hypothetical protein